MAGFSFLEGYIRNRFPGKLDFEKIPYSISFYDMIEAYIGYLSVQKTKKSFEEGKVISHTILLLIELNAVHSNTNPIRHTFSMEVFDEGSYYKLFRQLKEFFSCRG
ncbi:hypothetical protein [Treponema sp.]|jgi:hypothetical protein|uniref:hypothetical protein n=1 Tax=Treponema sp. TaxID=166 RepID=UPI0025799480|nr:hypothetical protein [Treponema sp.]MBE6354743.1 hypothetical protein [Treponema sp.]